MLSDTIIMKFLDVGGPYLTVLVLIIAWQFFSAWHKDKRLNKFQDMIHLNTESVQRLSTMIDVMTSTRGKGK
jgi:hypothetical protein